MPRLKTRYETDDFLLNSPGSSSYEPVLENLNDTSDLFLTGAAEPALPMSVSITGNNKERIEFTLLINPENMNHGKTNMVTNEYTRKGYVTQIWGTGQDTLTSTGKTAAFMAPREGLTYANTKSSFGFLNFIALFNAYKNNGYRLLDPVLPEGKNMLTRVVSVVNGVEIFYDNQIYMGHFNTFTMDDAAETPFILNYNFEFVCSSLDNNYRDVRGHFVSTPPTKGESSSAYTTQEEQSSDSAIKSGNTTTLVSDVDKYGSENPITQRKPLPDYELRRLWEHITSTPWNTAYDEGYTDLTIQGNDFLKTRLLVEEWPFNP